MKIILSRKGFDSENGGYSSPIINGRLVSLPIPDRKRENEEKCYSDLIFDNGISYFDLMRQLNPKIKIQDEKTKKFEWKELTTDIKCHCDPDIYPTLMQRMVGWRGAFGQGGKAQKHLEKQNIREGDIFLFFGRFKKVIEDLGELKFEESHSNHIIFGYLEISDILPVPPNPKAELSKIPNWLKDHPHITHPGSDKLNTIYLASEKLSFKKNLNGFGVFNFDENLVLTKQTAKNTHKISNWNLPSAFVGAEISYHSKNLWKEDYFKSATRGQEFVIKENKDIENWVKALINEHALKSGTIAKKET